MLIVIAYGAKASFHDILITACVVMKSV